MFQEHYLLSFDVNIADFTRLNYSWYEQTRCELAV